MRYSAPLDGIRAIAILAVLLFHIGPTWLTGGFAGVDVFFVLSGFLITSIILNDLQSGKFSLREFYLRRIQRLLPNVLLTVIVTEVVWIFFMPPTYAHQVATHGMWTIFNLSNIYILKYLGGYWGTAAEFSPLTHTWSLALEEQFYLLYPGLLLLAVRFLRHRVRLLLIVITVLSFGLCWYGSRAYPVATFYLLPTRLWELLVGGILAAHPALLGKQETEPRKTPGVNTLEALGVAGLLLVVLGFVLIDKTYDFPGLVSLAPTAGAALLIVSVTDQKTRLSRLLSTPFMVKIGKLSYSIYLWHWPFITLGRNLAYFYGKRQGLSALAGGLVSIPLAVLAYYLVEQPLRRRGPGRPRRFAIIGCVFLVAACTSGALISQHPVVDPEHRFDTIAFFGGLYNAGDTDITQQVNTSPRYWDVYFPPIPAGRPRDLWRTGGVLHLYGGGYPKVVVLGSSHALMYSKTIDDLCREDHLSVSFLGIDQTPALFEQENEFNETRKKWIQLWHPDVVFVIDRWDGRATNLPAFSQQLRSFVTQVSPMAGHVVFVAQVPAVSQGEEFNLREVVSWKGKDSNGLPRFYPDPLESVRKGALAAAEADQAIFPNLEVLRPDLAFYNQDGSVRYSSGRSFYYTDGDHLSQAGAETVRGLFQSVLETPKPDTVSKTK